MEIRWTPEASSCLENISLHIAENSPDAALKTVSNIFDRIEHLVHFPHVGRVGRIQGTRELVLAPLPYIAIYREMDAAVEVLQILHGAQDR